MATAILIMGLVGVAQLVPASLTLNSGNRTSSSSLVIAQRQLDTLVTQPLSATSFPDLYGNPLCTCLLGDPTQPIAIVGSPIIMAGNRPLIDFSQTEVPGYSYATPYTRSERSLGRAVGCALGGDYRSESERFEHHQ